MNGLLYFLAINWLNSFIVVGGWSFYFIRRWLLGRRLRAQAAYRRSLAAIVCPRPGHARIVHVGTLAEVEWEDGEVVSVTPGKGWIFESTPGVVPDGTNEDGDDLAFGYSPTELVEIVKRRKEFEV